MKLPLSCFFIIFQLLQQVDRNEPGERDDSLEYPDQKDVDVEGVFELLRRYLERSGWTCSRGIRW
jgi:hypothetical protein